MKVTPIVQGARSDGISSGTLLLRHLDCGDWRRLDIAVAFARFSGVRHFSHHIRRLSDTGQVRIAVGLDMGGTSVEAVRELLASVGANGSLFIFQNRAAVFHPKIFLLEGDSRAVAVIGSTNLTESGLFSNYEAGVFMKCDLSDEGDAAGFKRLTEQTNLFFDAGNGMSVLVTEELIDQLAKSGQLLPEHRIRLAMRTASKVQSKSSTSGDKVTFSSMAAVKPPSAPETFTSPDGSKLSDEEIAQEEEQIEEAVATEAAREDPSLLRAFVMTLQQTDVGSGQTTPGTSRRSPEIFIPLSARDYSPEFWGWPDEFEKDAAKEDKFDRRDVQFKLDTQIVSVNMMTWPDKHDFRLRAEALRSAGVVDDIIKIEKAPDDALYEYVVTVIPKGSVDYDSYLKRCTASVRNSRKQYGYF